MAPTTMSAQRSPLTSPAEATDDPKYSLACPLAAVPDVLAVDPGYGWLYVAAESGDLVVFDLAHPGLIAIDREHPGAHAHTVAVDPATHRVFCPLEVGPRGGPVLRVLQPANEP